MPSYVPHLEYQELPKCGHSPWLERQARQAFFGTLKAWLALLINGGVATLSQIQPE